MFFFDDTTCETSSEGLEKIQKNCNSTSAKIVYILKGYEYVPPSTVLPPLEVNENVQGGNGEKELGPGGPDLGVSEPPHCFDDQLSMMLGQEIETTVTCGVPGRKTCLSSGEIIEERNVGGVWKTHVSGLDYEPIVNERVSGCFIITEEKVQQVSPTDQINSCRNLYNSDVCAPKESDKLGQAVIMEIEKYADKLISNPAISKFNYAVYFDEFDVEWYWNETVLMPLGENDKEGNNCFAILKDKATQSISYGSDDCMSLEPRIICCMIGVREKV